MPDGTLSEQDRSKLDGIVSQMKTNGETDDAIGAVVNDFKTKYSGGTTAAPVTPRQSAHANADAIIKQAISLHGDQAIDDLNLRAHDMEFYNHRRAQQQGNAGQGADQGLTARKVGEGTDMGQQVESTGVKVPPPEMLQRDLKEKRDAIKANMTPEMENTIAHRIMQLHPGASNDIQAAMYLRNRDGQGKDDTVIKNAQDIQDGKLGFQQGRLIKPLGPLESIAHGYNERTQNLNNYDKYANGDPTAIAAELNNKKDDPDAPKPTPVGWGVPASSIGSEGIAMSKSTIAGGAAALIPGAEEMAPAAAVAASSSEYYKRAYSQKFEQSYQEAKAKGMPDADAVAQARNNAAFAGKVAVVQGAALTLAGGRLASAEGQELKGAVNKALSQTSAFTKNAIKEGALNSGVGAGAQAAQNVHEGKGISEGVLEGVPDNALMPVALGLMMKGVHGVSGKAVDLVKQSLTKVPTEVIQSHLAEMQQDGHITPQEAGNITAQIEEHKALDSKIPETVTDPEARLSIQSDIQKREALESRLKAEAKPYHEEIKSKIEKLDQRILDKSAPPEPTDEPEPAPVANTDHGNITEVRHGITDEDVKGIVSGQSDVPLNDKGKADVEKLAEQLKDSPTPVKKVISSDLPRGQESAKIIADTTGATVEHRPELRSWDLGEFSRTDDKDFRKAQEYFVEHPDEKTFGSTFKTSKGSEYKVEGNSTTRDKASRPDHSDSGPQEKSDKTYYISKADMDKLSLLQTQGGHKYTIAEDKGHIGIRIKGGPDDSKMVNGTIIKPSITPQVGLHPFEVFQDGGHHFGNDITEVSKGKTLNESFNEYKDRTLAGHQDIKDEPGTVVVNHSNNMMLQEAVDKNGGWNKQAEADYLKGTSPKPATIHDLPSTVHDTPEEAQALESHGKQAELELAKNPPPQSEIDKLVKDEVRKLKKFRSQSDGASDVREDKPSGSDASTEERVSPTGENESAATVNADQADKSVSGDKQPNNRSKLKYEVGSKVEAAFAGSRIKGEVVGHSEDGVRVKGDDGLKYTIPEKDILKHNESITEHYNKTPKDYRAELEKAIKKAKKSAPKVEDEEALPKLGEAQTVAPGKRTTPEAYANPVKALETIKAEHPDDALLNRAADFLAPIMKANPHIRIEDADLGGRVLGLSHPDGRIQVDFAAHPNMEEAHRTTIHEMIHGATRFEIEKNPAFKGELRTQLEEIRKALGVKASGDVGDALIPALVSRGIIPADKYGTSNEHELVAEVFSNQRFRDMLADLPSPVSTPAKPQNMLQRIFTNIARFFNKKYGALRDMKASMTATDMGDYLMKATEGTVKANGEVAGAALPKIGEDPVEDAVRDQMSRTSEDAPEDEIIKHTMEATGYDEAKVRRLMQDSGLTDRVLFKDAAGMITEGKADSQVMEYLKRRGLDDEHALAVIGNAKTNPLTPEDKAKALDEATKEYNKREDKWLGNKDWNRVQSKTEARRQQEAIKASAEKGQSSKDLDKAMQIYVDLKSHPEDFAKYYDKLSGAQKKIADLSQNLTEGQKKIAEEIAAQDKAIGQQAKDAGVITNLTENHVNRVWDRTAKGAPSTESNFKFATNTRHAKSRTYTSILQGFAEGAKLRIEGATNSLQQLKVEMGNLMENKQLISDALQMKYNTGDVDEHGKPVQENIFSTERQPGYEMINNESFKSGIKHIYAPADIAKSLNNILGKSSLNKYAFVKGITNFSRVAKESLLSLSGYHYIAFTRAHELTTSGTGLKGLSPRASFKEGVKMIDSQHPFVEALVKNGMTLNREQDYTEGVESHNSWLGKQIDKVPGLGYAKDQLIQLNTAFHKHLFETYGAGLKAFDGVSLLKQSIAKHPELSIDEHATAVGKLMNDTYGGINWDRMRGSAWQNATVRHATSLMLLAPDWTSSNLRFAKKAFDSGNEGMLYRKAWGRVLVRGAVLHFATNAIMASMDTQDGEDAMDAMKRHYHEAWQSGLGNKGDSYGAAAIRAMSIDLSPLYHWAGGNSDRKAYFSILGAYTDPLKLLGSPTDFLEAKLGYIPKIGLEAATGQNWEHKQFTTVDELFGMDDKGTYSKDVTSHKRGEISENTGEPYKHDQKSHSAGESKGGKLTGEFTKFQDPKDQHALNWKQLPSFIGAQARGMMPSAIQAAMQGASGENDGVTTILRAAGTGVVTPLKPKTP